MAGMMDDVLKTITKHKMLSTGDTVVVGVSGGPDSLCLLHVLHAISPLYQLKLYAVHLNHMFRGQAADEDAAFVRQICEEWGIKAFIETFNVPQYIIETGLSPEEAGREIRYRLFYETAEKVKAQKIAVAQNLNDQVETIFMRFLRGSGIDGLKGIEPVRGNIIRPLIDIERSRIEDYCAQHGLKARIDKTNLEPVYLRNKIRLELLPYLTQNFNPNLFASVVRFSHLVSDENEYLEKMAMEAFESAAHCKPGEVHYDIDAFIKKPIALKRRMLRLGIENLLGDLTGIEFKHVEKTLEIAGQPTGAAVILPRGLKAYISYNRLILTKNIVKNDKKCYYKLNYECESKILDKDFSIHIWPKNREEIGDVTKDKQTVFIDKSKVKNGLVLRNREEGDAFSPIGMKGTKKLKNYLIDEKIPKEERDSMLLLADGNEIVWVIGRRLSEKYKITDVTKDILVINFLRGTYNE